MQIIRDNKKTPDLTGVRFGFLTIKKFNGYKSNYTQFWECLCDCGNIVIVSKPNLTSNHTKSCGCYKNYEYCTTHKMTDTRVYEIWIGMKQRCNNPNYAPFKKYGARGIKVCDRWLESFENFLADMGEPPTSKHSIDRIDNNGNYQPSNCRWATPEEQGCNRRTNVVIKFNDKEQCLSKWCKELNLDYRSTHGKLRRGKSIESIFNHENY